MAIIQQCPLQKYVNKTANFIYRIDEKTLTLAGNEPGQETVPTAFERNATSQTRVMELTKQ